MRLIIRKDAEADIAEGYRWYEAKRDGLGREFLEEVSKTAAAVQSEPLRFPRIAGELRRALVHRFPYGVFFVDRAHAVVVVAAMYLGSDPRRIYSRGKPTR